MKIFKYPVTIGTPFSLMMPLWAKPICVQIDQKTGQPAMWVHVNEMNKLSLREFRVYGTGLEMYQPKDADLKYVGTFQMDEGQFVGHLYEVES